jgi:hypothetical protein
VFDDIQRVKRSASKNMFCFGTDVCSSHNVFNGRVATKFIVFIIPKDMNPGLTCKMRKTARVAFIP